LPIEQTRGGDSRNRDRQDRDNHDRGGSWGSSGGWGGHRDIDHRRPGSWDGFGWRIGFGRIHDPWTNWSNGLSFTVDSCGRDPWAYTTFTYGGPAWDVSSLAIIDSRPIVYEPCLGADVWRFDGAPCAIGPVYATDTFVVPGFDTPAATTVVRTVEPVELRVDARLLSRVNTAYDVRPDFAVALDAAVNGEYSAAISAMRRAAGVNPNALVGTDSAAGRHAATSVETAQRARYALNVFRNPPTRVVSEADARFMSGAFSAILGDIETARVELEAALAAGDSSASTALLTLAVRGEKLESRGPWVPGTPLGR
jgi:hypothetical protein